MAAAETKEPVKATISAEAAPPAVEVEKIPTIKVLKPEDWPEAVSVKEQRLVRYVGGNMKFELRALSYAEQYKLQMENPMPDAPKEKRGKFEVTNEDNNEHKLACDAVRFRRWIATIDLCAMKIPGESLDEKVSWAQDNIARPGDVLNLYLEIAALSGNRTGEKSEGESDILVTKAEDWLSASKAPTIFAFIRAKQRLEFCLKGVTSAKMKQIDIATNPGEPPVELIRANDGSRRGIPAPNPENPRYKQKALDCAEARSALVLEAGLPFTIPGETLQQKLSWLGKRPAWEVVKLGQFLTNEVLSYQAEVDFL